MLEESGDEEETNGIVNQVLDEIGIEISGKVNIHISNSEFGQNLIYTFRSF